MNEEPLIDSNYEEILAILDLFYYQNYGWKKIKTVSSELKMESRRFRKRIEELMFEVEKNDLPIIIQLTTTEILLEFSTDYFRTMICVLFMKQSFGFQLLDYLFQKNFKTIQLLAEALHVSKSTIFRQTNLLNKWLDSFNLKIDFSNHDPVRGPEVTLRHFYQQLYELATNTYSKCWPFSSIPYLYVKSIVNRLTDYSTSQRVQESLEIFIGILWQRKRKGYMLEKKDLELMRILDETIVSGELFKVFSTIFMENEQDFYFEIIYFQFYFEEIAEISYPLKDHYSSLWSKHYHPLTAKYIKLLEDQKWFLFSEEFKQQLVPRLNFLLFLVENFFLKELFFPMDLEMEQLKIKYPIHWRLNHYLLKKLLTKSPSEFWEFSQAEEKNYYFTILIIDLVPLPVVKILFDIKGYPLTGLKKEVKKNTFLEVDFVEDSNYFPDLLITNHSLDYYIPECQSVFFNHTLNHSFWKLLNNLMIEVVNQKIFPYEKKELGGFGIKTLSLSDMN